MPQLNLVLVDMIFFSIFVFFLTIDLVIILDQLDDHFLPYNNLLLLAYNFFID